MSYFRSCPQCNAEIVYKNARSFKWATRDNTGCRKCYSKKISETIKTRYNNGEYNFVPRNAEREKTKERNYHRNCPECGNNMSYIKEATMKESLRRNTICNRCSCYKYNKTFKDVIKPEHILQMRATKAGFSNFEEYKEKYPKKKFYKQEVWRLTYQHDLSKLPNVELRGRCGVDGAYQLDHIQSINWGWENGIEPSVIASMENLKVIPWRENLLKSSN
jgi:hypothetical protein